MYYSFLCFQIHCGNTDLGWPKWQFCFWFLPGEEHVVIFSQIYGSENWKQLCLCPTSSDSQHSFWKYQVRAEQVFCCNQSNIQTVIGGSVICDFANHRLKQKMCSTLVSKKWYIYLLSALKQPCELNHCAQGKNWIFRLKHTTIWYISFLVWFFWWGSHGLLHFIPQNPLFSSQQAHHSFLLQWTQ